MRNLLVVFIVFGSTQAFCNDPYREFMACVDEVLESNPKMDPKVAEDICSDLLDNIKDPSYEKANQKHKYGLNFVQTDNTILDLNALSLIKDIELQIADPKYQVVYMTTAVTAGYSLWWLLMNNPTTVLKLIAKRVTPALVLLPPGSMDLVFNTHKDKIILTGTKAQQKHLLELLKLSDDEKLQLLHTDHEFRKYLIQLRDSIQAQKFIILHKNKPVI